MNIKILSAIVITVVIALGTFTYLSQDKGPVPIKPENVVSKVINVSGMTCETCEIAINNGAKDKGIVEISSSAPNQRVEVKYDKTQTDIETIMKEIKRKGYAPVSYEDEKGLHNVNGAEKSEAKHEMKCGAGKCGGAK